MTNKPAPVEQVDVNAANAFWQWHMSSDENSSLATAFARHRQPLTARVAELEAALVSEREENLWHAYHAGHAKDGRWTHMFMSDGEWLAGECGFDCRLADYDDIAIQAAIPAAAKRVLEQKP